MLTLYKDAPTFIVDSEDRLTGTNEEFSVALNIKPNNNYDMCCLVHAGIPKTYYNIDSQNSKIIILENANQYTGNFPSGNYTSSNLPAIYATTLNAISSTNNPASPWTYSCIWDSFTLKWQFTVTDNLLRPISTVPQTSGFVFGKC